MNARMRRWVTRSLLLTAPVWLGGCVFVRLLELKRQLADFDRYFVADTRDGLKLTCKQPVLRDRDMAFLGLQPASRHRSGVAERWHFRWVKDQAPTDEPGATYDQTADFIFVHRRLTSVIVPERFFVFFPKEVVLAALRGIGHGKVDRGQRRLISGVEERDLPRVPPLRSASLREMLGEPVEVRQRAGTQEWRYLMQAEVTGSNSRGIDLTFVLDATGSTVRRIRGKLMVGEFEFVYPEASARGARAGSAGPGP